MELPLHSQISWFRRHNHNHSTLPSSEFHYSTFDNYQIFVTFLGRKINFTNSKTLVSPLVSRPTVARYLLTCPNVKNLFKMKRNASNKKTRKKKVKQKFWTLNPWRSHSALQASYLSFLKASIFFRKHYYDDNLYSDPKLGLETSTL